MQSKRKSKPVMLFADAENNIYDYPNTEAVFRSGHRFVRADENELIKLPYGSYMFMLPDRFPVTLSNNKFKSIKKNQYGKYINAVSAFLASGYLRTLLPAFEKSDTSVTLPLWAYCGAALTGDEFYATALRIDDDERSDPHIHEDHETLRKEIKNTKMLLPKNRLVDQLSVCATEYNCLCARNFFLGRHECPVPTSPACNGECIGCLSFQKKDSGFSQSQRRIEFSPTPDEVSEIIVHHIKQVDFAVASFGQGCEGEPLLRADDLAESIIKVRDKTDRGTINLNTNGSKPDAVKKLIRAGLDSIRVSLNSPTEKRYILYHRPVNYSYSDVINTIDIALEKGIFVSINLFFMPGFTDSISETESLINFLDRYPVSMIQTRNMNIDPDYYFEKIEFKDEDSTGIRNLIMMLGEKYKKIRLGYYNPPLKV